MLGALLFGLAGRVKGIGEKQEPGDQCWLFGAEHAGLASAIGVAAEEDRAVSWGIPCITHNFLYGCDCIFQAGAVAGAVGGAGRAEGSVLAVGEIAAEDGESAVGESIREGAEKRGLSVASGTVSEDERAGIGSFGRVQKADNVGVYGAVGEFADGELGHENILNG